MFVQPFFVESGWLTLYFSRTPICNLPTDNRPTSIKASKPTCKSTFIWYFELVFMSYLVFSWLSWLSIDHWVSKHQMQDCKIALLSNYSYCCHQWFLNHSSHFKTFKHSPKPRMRKSPHLVNARNQNRKLLALFPPPQNPVSFFGILFHPHI